MSKKLVCFLWLYAVLCVVVPVKAADQPVSLSLSEAVRRAAEKNLDVRAELFTPAQFEADLNRSKGIYDPLLNLQAIYNDTMSPVPVIGAVSSNTHFFQLNSSLNQLLWTGGTASLGFNNSFTNTNSTGTLNNYWQSDLGLTLTQPLLRNAGREATEININVARFSKFASLERFNTLLMNTVAQVRLEYFKLYSLREQLQVRKVSLDLARKILQDTKARVAVGVLPAMEILNAEFGATAREKEVIDAEKAVKDQVDVLRLLLQIEGQGDLITLDLPSREAISFDENQAIRHAMSRPEIREQKRNLDISELQTRVFSNRTKPDLSLIASGSLAGLAQNYPRTTERLGNLDYPSWSVGLNFSYPLGNQAAENDYRRSRLKTEQIALQIRSLEENAAKEVKAAIRSVSSNYKQIDVADRGRAYAEERLKAFIRKNEVGLATTKDVLDVENDLATAKNNQISAVVNYANAVTQLWQVTGELLEREGIRVVEGDADKLYSSVR